MNPFYCYSIILSIIFILYDLKWSDLYMDISLELGIFLLFTIVFSIGMGYLFNRSINFKIVVRKNKNRMNFRKITIFIILSYLAEFIYMKTIPFIEIFILKTNYNYATFTGIPTFHVFLITFNSFICVYIFDRYLVEKNKKYIIYFIINIIPSLLIYNRGMTIMILISCIFIYINHNMYRLFNIKVISIIAIVLLIFCYIFGILGNIRSNRDYYIGTDYANTGFIMNVGDASGQFRNSNIPKPFFWTYLYMTSPLANLQNTLDVYEGNRDYSIINFINRSIIPDFISKDIKEFYNLEYKPSALVYKTLTVSTLYSYPYIELGYMGLILMYIYMIILVFVYRLSLKSKSAYFNTGMSIINTLIVVSFFENMFTFSGLILQTIFPIAFSIYERINIKKN